MNSLMIPFALLTGVVLGGVALSLFALYRAKVMVQAVAQRGANEQKRSAQECKELQSAVESIGAQLLEFRREPAPEAPIPAQPKPGLNLSTRSQALRMHRRGDEPELIAAALDVPRQEIELLVKVHQIVMSTV